MNNFKVGDRVKYSSGVITVNGVISEAFEKDRYTIMFDKRMSDETFGRFQNEFECCGITNVSADNLFLVERTK